MAGKTWLAVGLSLFVWFFYIKFFAPPPPAHVQTPAAAESSSEPQGQGASVAGSNGSAAVSSNTQPTSATFQKDPFSVSFPQADQNLVFLQNGNMRVAISPVGAKPLYSEALGYRVTLKKDSPHIRPLSETANPFSFATLFSSAEMRELSNATYEVGEATERTAVFTKEYNGITISKKFEVQKQGHFVDASVVITFPDGSSRADWGELLLPLGADGLKYEAQNPLEAWEAVKYQDQSVSRTHYDSIKGDEATRGNTGWIAFGNRYFSTAAVTLSSLNPDVVMTSRPGFNGVFLRYPLLVKGGEAPLEFNFKLFMGPKDLDEFSKVEGMKKLVDYGFFSFFAYPMLAILRFFYSLFHNYGVAIILLTLLVRALFYPLSLKSYRSMKQMQKLQPKLKVLREKYKDDMQRMNQEQMAMFKAHNVNPMGGCLPLLVQMPVFFALYTLLSNSIELFQAPFFGWIMDLSAKDPYYVFPVLMGISMFAQQKMTPTGGMDPMQAKMMMLMPIIFTFVMLNLPSGLTIYIFLSTLLGITQQYFINREPKGAVVAASEETSP